MDPSAAILVRLVAAIGVSLLLSLTVGGLLLRLDRRGSGVVGGVCAGVALGPMVFGALAPGAYADVMVGGVRASAEAARIEARLPGEVAALVESGVSEVAAEEHAAAERSRVAELRREADRDRSLRRAAAGAAAGSCALLAGVALARPVRVRWASVGAGGVSAALSGLAGAVVVRLVTGAAIETSLAAGAVVAGGVVTWRGAARCRSHGLGAMAVSAAGLCAFAGVWPGVSLLAMVGLGVLLRRLDAGSGRGAPGRGVVDLVLVPTSAALILPLAGTDLTTGGVVLVAAACLLAGDAQLAGVWLGSNLCESGRWRGRPMTAWLVRFGRGGASWQVLLLGLCVAGAGIDPAAPIGSAVVYAVAGCAVSAELTRPSAQRAIRRFQRELSMPDE